jgi:hypothetical protein
MKTITLYRFSELSPEAQSRAIRDAQNETPDITFTLEEMRESLKAVCDASGLRLVNWSFGSYDRNHDVTVTGRMEDESGPRALAWFLRILIENGYARPKRFAEMEFPGVCGFTGVGFDDDVCETVWKALLDGDTVRRAFDAVSGEFCRIAEAEEEYLRSEEMIRESLESDDAEVYDEEGGQQ